MSAVLSDFRQNAQPGCLSVGPSSNFADGSQPHGRKEAIEFVWRQPDKHLTLLEKQSIAAALAKGTDDTATSLFVAPCPEQWVGALKEFIAGLLSVSGNLWLHVLYGVRQTLTPPRLELCS